MQEQTREGYLETSNRAILISIHKKVHSFIWLAFFLGFFLGSILGGLVIHCTLALLGK